MICHVFLKKSLYKIYVSPIYLQSLGVYNDRSGVIFQIESKEVKNGNISYLFTNGKYKVHAWTRKKIIHLIVWGGYDSD